MNNQHIKTSPIDSPETIQTTTFPQYAAIVVNIPLDKIYHYAIPEEVQETIQIGMQVEIPFCNRKAKGFVVGFVEQPEVKTVKTITKVYIHAPIIPSTMMQLAKWISSYYLCSLGESLSAFFPSYLKKTNRTHNKNFIEERDSQSKAPHPKPNQLTLEQKHAIESINTAIIDNKPEAFLLHGITGSGKTEVYLQSIEYAISHNKSSIVLVPEIALTPQASQRFFARFGSRVVILHSNLLPKDRYNRWKKIATQDASVVIGPRSTIFAPVKNLGLIVIDEEHETTYKQEDNPRYDARDVAYKRISLENATVVLGSATPSLETYYKAINSRIKLLTLPNRILTAQLPEVVIVDMKNEKKGKFMPFISFILQKEIEKCLAGEHQCILFLNRRGFSPFIQCPSCGHVVKCTSCDISLVYHQETEELQCHYCDYNQKVPNQCPECNNQSLRYLGIGTQRLEKEIKRLFPFARVARMDTDSTAKRGSHAEVIQSFQNKEIDILVGTQMVAKGHDFPNVTLVGILAVDIMLNIPDFRSGERGFNLITQAAGRAGRGEHKGKVIVQTFSPEHYSILAAKTHSYDEFYDNDIKIRESLLYPPFSQIIKIIARCKTESTAQKAIESISALLTPHAGNDFILLGPSTDTIAKLRGYFRMSLIIKNKKGKKGRDILKKIFQHYKKPSQCFIAINIDPR